MKYVIGTGNPFDGMTFFGPFDDREDALKYAEDECLNHDVWWIVPLQPSLYVDDNDA